MTGRTIARYEVLDKLGEGGMGVVYRTRAFDGFRRAEAPASRARGIWIPRSNWSISKSAIPSNSAPCRKVIRDFRYCASTVSCHLTRSPSATSRRIAVAR